MKKIIFIFIVVNLLFGCNKIKENKINEDKIIFPNSVSYIESYMQPKKGKLVDVTKGKNFYSIIYEEITKENYNDYIFNIESNNMNLIETKELENEITKKYQNDQAVIEIIFFEELEDMPFMIINIWEGKDFE